jgi:hypothetical protein
MADFRAMEHEEALIRAFITPTKRQRYLDTLGSPTARQKFLSENIHHMGDLDERYAEKVDPHKPRDEALDTQIYDLLRERGAPSRCYVISTGFAGARLGERICTRFGVGLGRKAFEVAVSRARRDRRQTSEPSAGPSRRRCIRESCAS